MNHKIGRVRYCSESDTGVTSAESSIVPQSGIRFIRPCWVHIITHIMIYLTSFLPRLSPLPADHVQGSDRSVSIMYPIATI